MTMKLLLVSTAAPMLSRAARGAIPEEVPSFIGTFRRENSLPDGITICPGGVTVTDEAAKAGCKRFMDMLNGAPSPEACKEIKEMSEEACKEIKEMSELVESACCPSTTTGQSEPCTICPSGVAPYEHRANNFDLNGCEEALAALKGLPPQMCGKATDRFKHECCQTDPPSDPCIVCPEGVTVSDPDPHGCKEWVNNFKWHGASSQMCTGKEDCERTCCPSASNACIICPGGVTTTYYRDDCEKSIDAYSKLYGPSSQECADAIKSYQPLCCPSASEHGLGEPGAAGGSAFGSSLRGIPHIA